MKQSIFVTGASGCVGHYLLKQLLLLADVKLYLLVRGSSKFLLDLSGYQQVTIIHGNLATIEKHRELIGQMDYIIHLATSWAPSSGARQYNVEGTMKLFGCCDLERCKRIIYFSTASILNSTHQPIDLSHTEGSWYIRTKREAYDQIQTLPIYPKIVTMFPTMVIGGNDETPYSHILDGIRLYSGWLSWLRFFSLPGSFHFLHAADIATVVCHLLFKDTVKPTYVLGGRVFQFSEAIRDLCTCFSYSFKGWIKISTGFLKGVARLLPKRVGPWERYCLDHLDMVYDTVEPRTFGLVTKYPTFPSFL